MILGTDDETFEEVFHRAMQMRDESENKMLGYKDRQKLLEQVNCLSHFLLHSSL